MESGQQEEWEPQEWAKAPRHTHTLLGSPWLALLVMIFLTIGDSEVGCLFPVCHPAVEDVSGPLGVQELPYCFSFDVIMSVSSSFSDSVLDLLSCCPESC